MRIILTLFLVVIGFTATANEQKIDSMLRPMATVKAGNAFGTGTAVHVDDRLGTYIVSNLHVTNRKTTDITVTFYGSTVEHPAYVHSYDEKNDIVVLITPAKHNHLATFGNEVSIFDPVYCVGNSLDKGIVPSRGEITQVDHPFPEDRLLTRADCKIVPGNSGGAMFVERDGVWVYIGMPAMMYTLQTGFLPQPIPHLGMMIRVQDITAHLSRNNIPYRTHKPPDTPNPH